MPVEAPGSQTDAEAPPLTLVALAAGLGSRFGGSGGKQIAGVGPEGETLLDYSVHAALAAGFTRLILVVQPDLEAQERIHARLGQRLAAQMPLAYVAQRLEDLPAGLEHPKERSKPWGTGHAVWVCREAVTGPFAVINADDLYGPEAFRLLADQLMQQARVEADPPGEDEHPPRPVWSMVAYDLGRTLPEQGAVSRGICNLDAEGRLQGIEERHHIARDGARIRAADDREPETLPAGSPVSINLWGFSPAVFPLLEARLRHFLEAGPDASAEFMLPEALATLIGRGAIEVQALRSDEAWLGLTHPDDLDRVRAGIAERIEAGQFPDPLWGTSGGA